MFTEEEKAILNVRPGITDWASIWDPDEGTILAGSPDPEKTYMEKIRPEKIRLQLKYVRERSLITDLKIIVLTLLVLLRPQSPAVKELQTGVAGQSSEVRREKQKSGVRGQN
jgi:lipopolysaccharide/colanic/teichoic acid biosynthesis glycosyltransferase